MNEKNKITSISITTNTMIRAVLVCLGFFLIYFLSDIVLVILTAIVVASFAGSAAGKMKKIGIGRVLGVVVIYLTSIAVLAVVFYLFTPLLITEIYNFSTFLSTYIPDNSLINYFQNDAFSGAKDIVASLSANLSLANLVDTSKAFISNLSSGFFTTLSSAFGSIFNVGMIIVISFYLSIQEKGIESFLRIVVPPSHEDYAVDLWNRSHHKIALWVKGQMLLGLLIAVLVYLVLSLLGIQYALLLAIITGIMELIPYGFIVAMVPAVSFAFLSGGFSSSLMVFGAYFIIHQFEVYLLYPLVVKKVVGLSPLIVILSILVGFKLAGFWGLILAIPFAVSIMEFLNDVEKDKVFTQTTTSNDEK